MLQFVIIARDGADEGAYERRMAVRQLHLEGAKKLKANNNYICGGAILNETGVMCGSVMMVQFTTPEHLHQWLENEPYLTGKVWETCEVKPFRLAEV